MVVVGGCMKGEIVHKQARRGKVKGEGGNEKKDK